MAKKPLETLFENMKLLRISFDKKRIENYQSLVHNVQFPNAAQPAEKLQVQQEFISDALAGELNTDSKTIFY